MTVLATYYHLIAKGRLTPEDVAELNDKRVLVEAIKSTVRTSAFNKYIKSRNLRLLKVVVSRSTSDPKIVVRIEAFVQGTAYQEIERVCVVDSQLLGENIQIEHNRDIKVDKNWRDWGVGRIVLSHWIEWAQKSYPALKVEPILPVLKRRDQLQKFYKMFGFSWERGLDHSDPIDVVSLQKASTCSYQIEEHDIPGLFWLALQSSAKDIDDIAAIVKRYREALGLSGTLRNRIKNVWYGADPKKLG